MQTQQIKFQNDQWDIRNTSTNFDAAKVQLAIVFGSGDLAGNQTYFNIIQAKFPNADIVTSSTAGEIIGEEVYDDTLIVTAIHFEKSKIQCIKTSVTEHADSFETGKYLFNSLNNNDLSGLFIISDGTKINGSEIVDGLNLNNHKHLPITGGLAGDADVVYRDRHKECAVAEAIQVATLALKIAEMFQYEIDKEEK